MILISKCRNWAVLIGWSEKRHTSLDKRDECRVNMINIDKNFKKC